MSSDKFKDPAAPVAKPKADDKPQAADEIVFYEGTIAKVVTDDKGNETVVMSDHVGPGEKLKSVVDQEKAEAKLKAADKK